MALEIENGSKISDKDIPELLYKALKDNNTPKLALELAKKITPEQLEELRKTQTRYRMESISNLSSPVTILNLAMKNMREGDGLIKPLTINGEIAKILIGKSSDAALHANSHYARSLVREDRTTGTSKPFHDSDHGMSIRLHYEPIPQPLVIKEIKSREGIKGYNKDIEEKQARAQEKERAAIYEKEQLARLKMDDSAGHVGRLEGNQNSGRVRGRN